MVKSKNYVRFLFEYNFACNRGFATFKWTTTNCKTTKQVINLLLKEGAITHFDRTTQSELTFYINYREATPVCIVSNIKQLRYAGRYVHWSLLKRTLDMRPSVKILISTHVGILTAQECLHRKMGGSFFGQLDTVA